MNPSAPPAPPTPADIAVQVLTHNGARHLPACLTACLALHGLDDPAAIVVADNGSTDADVGDAIRAFSTVTRVDLGANLGFAGGYNALADSGAGDRPWLLFLNDDTAIAPDALTALCAALGPGDVCAGARLVDWAGSRIDFDGGAASWTGHGHAIGHGRRLAGRGVRGVRDVSDIRDVRHAAGGRPTLFACGGAMLVHRATFLALGGFDASYFMYYEDVDFGWRLTLAGHDVRHVPSAVVRHRGGGSAAVHPGPERARWHARNALANVAKNTAAGDLARVLPAAVALEAVRRGAPLDVVDAADRVVLSPLPLPSPDWPGWPYLAPLGLDWPALAAARAAVQPLWARRPDDVVARLGRPWAPVPASAAGWAALRRAAAVFALEDIFGPIDAHTGLRGRLRRAALTLVAPRARPVPLPRRGRGTRWRALIRGRGAEADRRRLGRPDRARLLGRESAPANGSFAHDVGEGQLSPVQGESRMRAAPVDIVIVAWNNRGYLGDLLPALAAQTHPPRRVVVVDNGSGDGTVEWLAEAWPATQVVALGANVGFAAANNRGLAVCDAPWVALVNSDTVPEPGWLAALVAAGRSSPRIGSVASLMLFMDRPDVVNSAGVAVDPTGIAWDWLGGAPAGELPFDAAATAVPVFGASAGAALYRRAALDDVSPRGEVFDERYFMYLEDVDLAWRLRLRGWDAALAPGARILHVGSGTSGEGSAFKNRLLARNKVWTVLKDYPTWPLLARLPLVVAYDLASVPYRVVVNGQTAALRGRLDALAHIGWAMRARRRVQAARTAPWSFVAAAMAPLATPWSVARRYRHLRPAAMEAAARDET